MVLGDICTDCGVSPQDVRHLFACTTHPTDLSPEDLWRNRWDQFVRLAIPTTETLTDLTTDLLLLLFAMIRSVVKSFKVPDVEVIAARVSNELALTCVTDSTPKNLGQT